MPAPRKTSKIKDDDTVHVVFVMDETGSMITMKAEAQQGFNSYIDTLKADSEHEYRFSLLRFDTLGLWEQYDDIPLSWVEPMTDYTPGAGTPLYDAVAHAIHAHEKHLKVGQPAKVIVVVMTDGQENSSREYSAVSLNSLLKAKELVGWTFVYLAVGVEAWRQENIIGTGTTLVQNVLYSSGASGMAASAQAMADTTVRYAATAKAGMSWVNPDNDALAARVAAESDQPVPHVRTKK